MGRLLAGIHTVSRVFFWVGSVVLGAGILLSAADALSRKFLNHPFAFTIELVELMMIVLAYLGLAFVTSRKAHIEVDILVPRLPLRVQYIIHAATYLLCVGMLFLFAWQMVVDALLLLKRHEVTMFLHWSASPFVIVAAVCSVLAAIEFAILLVENIKSAVHPEAPAVEVTAQK